MKILHTSDLHIGSPLTSRLSADKVRERKSELLANFEKMVEEAVYQRVGAFIIAGDLFDGKYVTPEQFKQNYIELIEIIKRANPSCTVVILSATTNKYTIEGHVEKTAEMVQELSLPYIDTHSLWLSHYDESAGHFGHGDWLYDDNDACHPTQAGSEKTAEFIFSEFIALCEAEKI